METQNDLKDTEGFDWLESAIDRTSCPYAKILPNRLFVNQAIPENED